MSDTLLVGCGPMAVEYAKVLKSLGVTFDVVGRSKEGCAKFFEATGVVALPGGLEQPHPRLEKLPKSAIVAVSEEALGEVTLQLILRGVKRILVEKPGCFLASELPVLLKAAKTRGAKVFVGYNRRFYASVLKAQEILAQDGGVTSFYFDFTEWSHRIAPLPVALKVKEQYFFHNSTHVTDLAFYLGGAPKEMTSFVSGALEWHTRGSHFSGAGVADSGALFSYHANWDAPGRWRVELNTRAHKVVLCPLEKLQIQKIGSVAIEEVPLEDRLDQEFKPGLYRQVEAFWGRKSDGLLSLEAQANQLLWHGRILEPGVEARSVKKRRAG